MAIDAEDSANIWAGYVADATFDEMLDRDGRPRSGCDEIHRRLVDLGPELLQRQAAGDATIRSMGITFSLGASGAPATPGSTGSTETGIDRSWPLDIIPRLITGTEWGKVTDGLVQRLKALNLFIDDLYHDRQVVADGIIPADLIDGSPNYQEACRGVDVPDGVWAHICGTDLVRDHTGQFVVLEDNLRIPSGVSYLLANRLISKRVFADLFRNIDILPVEGYLDRLRQMLRDLAPADTEGEPVVVVLTPGIYNAAYYEHAYLADRLGAQLVEGGDLVVQDDTVFMRTVKGLVRVHVVYRRIDDDFLDPEEFRSDSVLGASGLMSAWRSGRVALVNAPGAGVADDKVIYSYVPDLIEYYLDEKALLPNVETWRLNDPEHRAHVLADLTRFVCKPANGAGGKGLVIGDRATASELHRLRETIEADPRGWIAQPILNLSTAPTIIDDAVAPRHIDLRPFVLSGKSPYVSLGGLTRVAMREGSLVVNSSQGGGSKDTWIVGELGGSTT